MSNGLATGVWEAFISYMFKTGDISVPGDFKGRCGVVSTMLDNDISGVVSTIIDYSINSASEAKFKVECSDSTLEDLLTLWLERINININGIPTGLQELAREYYKERWAGSSLCLLKVSKWEKISIGAISITVPTVLWFVNGASVYIKRISERNFKLGSDLYFLDESMKRGTELPVGSGQVLVQKPFDRWFTQYPTPYLIKKGVYKNWRALEILQSKADEVITKILPYLFVIEKGDKDVFLQKDVSYSDTELQKMVDNFKSATERYTNEREHLPVAGIPFDQKYSHLIPDLKNILNEELSRQGLRAILSGLGFVDVIQGVTSTRREAVLNPKPFVAEVNAGVDGFRSMLMDVIRSIIEENKLDHKKLFSVNNPLRIISSPITINVENLMDTFRSAYVYGVISVQSYQERLGIDPDQELERMKKEMDSGLRDIYYPHLIQNQENTPDSNVSPAPVTKKQTEKQVEKEKKPPTMNKAGEDFEIAPYNQITDLPPAVQKYPEGAQRVFLEVFNSIYNEHKDEARAFAGAWAALKKWMRRHMNKGENK